MNAPVFGDYVLLCREMSVEGLDMKARRFCDFGNGRLLVPVNPKKFDGGLDERPFRWNVVDFFGCVQQLSFRRPFGGARKYVCGEFRARFYLMSRR